MEQAASASKRERERQRGRGGGGCYDSERGRASECSRLHSSISADDRKSKAGRKVESAASGVQWRRAAAATSLSRLSVDDPLLCPALINPRC